ADYVLHTAAPEPASQGRYDAVGAVVVTALRYLYVRPVFTGADYPLGLYERSVDIPEITRTFSGRHVRYRLAYLLKAAAADDGVGLRELLQYLVLIPLHKTACDDYPAHLARRLVLRRLEYGVYRLFLGALYKAAGVDYE